MAKSADHNKCDSHFRHPAFKKRLCVRGQSEAEARAFADYIASVMAKRPRA